MYTLGNHNRALCNVLSPVARSRGPMGEATLELERNEDIDGNRWLVVRRYRGGPPALVVYIDDETGELVASGLRVADGQVRVKL